MSPPKSAHVEDLLAAVLDRPEADWQPALAEACARHPQDAGELRARFQRLVELDPDADHRLMAIPERIGRYDLLERIGGGGMGVVYRARDRELGREVALKLVRPELLYFPGARERFRREIAASAALQHAGIVSVHEFGEVDGVPYFAMELVHGLSLAEIVERLRGRDPAALSGEDVTRLLAPLGTVSPLLSEATWCELCTAVIAQAAHAVEHAHTRGVVHRDLKPGNVMLTPDGRVRLLDFGVSLKEGTSRMTRSGAAVGSLLYSAPEVLRTGAGDRRVDVYGLGVTLYELLTLRVPFLAHTPDLSRQRILEGRCEPLAAHQRAAPRDLATVCMQAMDVDPERRYASARVLAYDLEQSLGHRPIIGRRPGVALRARRFARRHPTLVAIVAFGLLLALGAPTLLWLQSRAYVSDLERLSDELLVDDLLAEEERLWPATPERASAMAAWIVGADELLARQPQHERTLAALRRGALARTPDEMAQELELQAARRARADEARRTIERLRARGLERASSRELAHAEDELQELGATDDARSAWRFADTAASWQHSRLVALLAKLRRLPALRADVSRRRAFAEEVTARTIEAPRAAWAMVAAALSADPRFGGVALTPQRGLVPLGPDPESGLQEFGHLQSGELAQRDGTTGRLRLGVETGVVLVLVPPGSFTMGAERPEDPHALPPEGPAHEVPLDAFFIAKHELTQAQWFRATGVNPAEITPGEAQVPEPIDLRHPVENVSWIECERTLSRLELQLPTEAQWERAARAGATTPWWTGPSIETLAGAANVRDETVQELHTNFEGCAPFRDGFVVHAPIGSFRANAFGLHDMLGNVNEWVRDTFNATDPTVASYSVPGRTGDGLRLDPAQTNAIYRGGGYMDDIKLTRVSSRRKEERSNRWSYIGVRPARRIVPPR